MKHLSLICLLLCSLAAKAFQVPDTLTLYDEDRKRAIPIAVYKPRTAKPKMAVLLSHGYGQNRAGSYLAYSYIAEYLAEEGYLVVSIQHELSTDSLLPLTGIPQIVRRPAWERGAENIRFVQQAFVRKHFPSAKKTVLLGHSNGGDMSVLFAHLHLRLVAKIITLDHRRMPLPRVKKPKLYSLRSSDQQADEGVLPSEAEQRQLGIAIVKLPNTIHNDMDDHATAAQRDEIRKHLLSFLRK